MRSFKARHFTRFGIVLFGVLLALAPFSALAVIRHVELGVANYGPNNGDSPSRFKVLDETLEDLVAHYGDTGTIYLNDIDADGLQLAAEHARQWLQEHGLSRVKIKLLPGDYTEIEIPRVTSMHLTNPGHAQLPSSSKGVERNQELTAGLEKLAALSETGLNISTYYHDPFGNHMTYLLAFARNSVFIATNEKGYAYFTPDGTNALTGSNVPSETKVFILISRNDFCPFVLTQRPAPRPGKR